MVGLAAAATAPDSDNEQLPVWRHLVGAPHALRAQAECGNVWPGGSPGHDDSWGVGWFDRRGLASVIRQTGSAVHSAYFVFAAETAARGGGGSGPASVALGHLRKASRGAVTSDNAHPVQAFYDGGRESLLVAHNGTLHPPLLDTLRPELADAGRRAEASSDSDTVTLAGWLALRAEQGTGSGAADPFDAMADALRDLFGRAASVAPGGDVTKAYSGVNLLLARPDGLLVLRQFSLHPEYYTLFARPLGAAGDRAEDGAGGAAGWLVSSEPTDGDGEADGGAAGWEPLEPGILTLYPTRGGVVRTARVA